MLKLSNEIVPPPLDLSHLEIVEEELELKFPNSLISFLQIQNGGIPVDGAIVINGTERLITRVLSVLTDEYTSSDFGYFDIEVIWGQIFDRIGDDAFPIAEIFAGDYICLKYTDKEKPIVVLWEHEKSDIGSPSYVNISSCFVDFLKLIAPA